MKISVFGLGYVGSVTAACLAHDGHDVIGLDVNPAKVHRVETGQSPVSEPGLEEIIFSAVQTGRLRASTDGQEAVKCTEASLICVGTPSSQNGKINLQYVENVCCEIGQALRSCTGYHVVVVRSTVLPHTVQDRLIPSLENYSRHRAGVDFGVCMNPEFLREGSAIKDYYHPGTIIIGELDQRSGDKLECLYRSIDAPLIRTSIPVAEIVKYANNAFHAVKVTFANEIGNLCKAEGIDGQEVMKIACMDRRLNISPAYMQPGFAFGGSCLPKDLRALTHRAKEVDIETPMLNAVMLSNRRQVERAIEMVENSGRHRIAVLGLSFKPGTDDVRESPNISLVETLIGRGYQVSVYDEHVEPARLFGANRAFLERELPHVASLMSDSIEKVVGQAEVVVITYGSPAFQEVPKMICKDQVLIDLVGIAKNNGWRGEYEGICW